MGASQSSKRAYVEELRSGYADAQAEMDTVTMQIEKLKTDLERSNMKLGDIAGKELDMSMSRQMLLMECHDGLVHPCLVAVESCTPEEIAAIENAPVTDDEEDDGAKDEDEKEGEDSSEETSPEDPRSERVVSGKKKNKKKKKACTKSDIFHYRKILAQRKYLDGQFESILQVLSKAREDAETHVFNMEFKLVSMIEDQKRASLEVRRLYRELQAEERKLNGGHPLPLHDSGIAYAAATGSIDDSSDGESEELDPVNQLISETAVQPAGSVQEEVEVPPPATAGGDTSPPASESQVKKTAPAERSSTRVNME